MPSSYGDAIEPPAVGALPSLTQQIRLQKLTGLRWVLLILGIIIGLLGVALIASADRLAKHHIDQEAHDEFGIRRDLTPEQREEIKQLQETAKRGLRLIGALFTLVGVVYLAFAALVKKYPLPITIMAMAMFITGNALTLLSPHEPFAFIAATWWLSACIMAALTIALRGALAYGREGRRAELLAEIARQQMEKEDERAELVRDDYRDSKACWRCGKDVPVQHWWCPYCRAPFGSRRRRDRDDAHSLASFRQDARSIKVVLSFFAVLLSVTILHAWFIYFGPGMPGGNKQEQEMGMLKQMLVVEAIDTLIVVIAIVWAGAPRPFRPTGTTQLTAWVVGLPVLGLLLGINVAYSHLLQEYIGKQPHIEVIQLNFENYFWLVLLTVCIQPGVVEELFFRYLCLGHLRRVMSMHGAVWVTAVMFGLAHLHNPIGMPVLITIGAGLGYLRVKSGNLALPIIIHALHNAIVTMMDK